MTISLFWRTKTFNKKSFCHWKIFQTFAQFCQLLTFVTWENFHLNLFSLVQRFLILPGSVWLLGGKKSMITVSRLEWNWSRLWNDVGWYIQKKSKTKRLKARKKTERVELREAELKKRRRKKKEVGEHVKLRDSTAQHFEMQKLREFYSFALFFLPCRGSLLGESKFSKWKKKWSGSGFTFVWASHSRLYYVTQHDHTIGPGRRVYVAFFLTIVMSWYKFHFHPQTLRRLSLSFHTQHRPRVFGRRRRRLLSHPPPHDYIVHRVFETINEPRIYIRYISRSIEL